MGFQETADQAPPAKSLREIHFGASEGLHFDSLSELDKAKLRDLNYQAPEGESWPFVRKRAISYFETLGKGNNLVFTHGGLITSYLLKEGVTEVPNNCSVFGVLLNEDKDLGEVKKLAFEWHFPYIEEDI